MRAKNKKDINIIVGENIREHREKFGYSRERFAELVGITPRFLADAENGYVGVSLTNLKKICELLGVSADRLLWDDKSNVSLDEKLSHVDMKYMPLILDIIQKQLELITLADCKDNKKKTRN